MRILFEYGYETMRLVESVKIIRNASIFCPERTAPHSIAYTAEAVAETSAIYNMVCNESSVCIALQISLLR